MEDAILVQSMAVGQENHAKQFAAHVLAPCIQFSCFHFKHHQRF